MIRPATATCISRNSTRKDTEIEEEEDETDLSMSITDDSDSESEGHEKEEEEKYVTKVIYQAWKALSPPNTEADIVGKWFGVVYHGGKKPMLHVAKVMKRFLQDEDGAVDSVKMECLMAKVGSGNVLKAIPSHLAKDTSFFKLDEVIHGPLVVTPKVRDSRLYEVKEYEKLKELFQIYLKLDRQELLKNYQSN